MPSHIIIRKEIHIRNIIYLLLIIILIPAFFYVVAYNRIYNKHLKEIKTLISQNENMRAEDDLRRYLAKYRINKSFFELYSLNKYQYALQQNNPVLAIKAITTLKQYENIYGKNHYETIYRLGYLFNRLGRHYNNESAIYFERLLTMAPAQQDRELLKDTFYRLYTIYSEIGEYIKAENYIKKAIEYQPDRLELQLKLYSLYYDSGEKIKAKEMYEKFIQKNSNNSSFYLKQACFNLISILKEFKIYSQVVFYYDFLLYNYPENVEVLKDYGLYQYSNDNTRAARQLWYKALAINKTNKELRYYIKHYK